MALKDADRLQQSGGRSAVGSPPRRQMAAVPEPVHLDAVARDCADGLRVRFPEANFMICTQ